MFRDIEPHKLPRAKVTQLSALPCMPKRHALLFYLYSPLPQLATFHTRAIVKTVMMFYLRQQLVLFFSRHDISDQVCDM